MHNQKRSLRGRLDDATILREIARRIRDGMDRAHAVDGNQSPVDAPEANAHRPDLISRLAHELRSPISAIVSAAEVMAEQQLGPLTSAQYQAYAENIATSGRHALAVIDRVLEDWQQSDTGTKLDFVELDLNALVERTVSVLRPLMSERRHSIVTRLEDRLPHVIVDATSLRQILLNLINNAGKYAIEGCDITVATRYVLDGPVILEVSDPGPGMSPEAVARALADTSKSTPEREGGLGLPLVRRLAAANGATMAIDSAPGTSTSVTITFVKNKVIPI